jgi:hypothetical protein
MIKKINHFLYLLGLITIGITATSNATDTTAAKSSFQFLEESTSPRNIGMGNVGTANAGMGFCYYNPAQPYLTNDPSLTIGYSPLPGDLTAVFADGFWNASDLFFGVHLSNHSITGIIPSTVQGPNQSTEFSSAFSLVSFSAGLTRPRYCLALSLSGMQDRIGVATAYGVSLSAGAAYKIIPGKFTMGLGLLNEGQATGYTEETKDWGKGDPLPRSARLGLAYQDTLKRVPFTVACDIVYRDVGDKVREARIIAPRMSLPIGIEIWPTDYVAFRLGKRFNYETEIVNVGAGLKFHQLSFDMSMIFANLTPDLPHAEVEIKPTFGLTYTPVFKKPANTIIKAPPLEVKPLELPAQEQKKPMEIKSNANPAASIQEIQPVEMAPKPTPVPSDSLKSNPPPVKLEKPASDSTVAPEKK